MARYSFGKPLIWIGLAAVVAAGGWLLWRQLTAETLHYTTTAASTGSIVREISASGSVNPVVNVQVGAFVSGNIQSLYCDYNTQVRKGQLCAAIDPRPYQLTADQARAAVATAKAQLTKDQAGQTYAELNYGRLSQLLQSDSTSRDSVDTAKSQRDQAVAQVALDRATLQQRQAALEAAEVNLGYTRIISPVDGTVVARNVTVGQTVAASFQTPTLFLIAQDLKQMQVDTNVSESDIAGATSGAAASFTVAAFPGRVFKGKVVQVRQAPVSVQNVITYDVVIAADNPDLALKPGMTATAKIVAARRDNVLRVPAQALHYTPSIVAAGPSKPGKGAAAAESTVWVLREHKPVPVSVTTGMSDDAMVEITAGDLHSTDRVITGETRGKASDRGRKAPQASPIRLGR